MPIRKMKDLSETEKASEIGCQDAIMMCNACVLCSILIECNFKVFNDQGLAFFGGFLFKLTLGWDWVVVLGILCGISLSCDIEGASSIFIKELGSVKCKRVVIYKLFFMLCPTALFHHL